jgi:hypothetical protein
VKITIFSEELRKCLNAAGLSDCGENDTWNYWYQRVLKAHNDAVERQIATEQSDNARLRELVKDYIDAPCTTCDCWQDEFRCWNYDGADCGLVARARELGVEVDA